MSDYLVKRLRDLGDRAEYAPHVHHIAADRIEELEAKLTTARNDTLQEVADWHIEVAKHDQEGLDYSSLVGIPISNWAELVSSVQVHEWCAREMLNLAAPEKGGDA